MSNFKPQATYTTLESIREYRNGFAKSSNVVKRYSTYRELKQNLKSMLNETVSDYISVIRSKRGEWGEWWEHWGMINGKPTIIKQGWN